MKLTIHRRFSMGGATMGKLHIDGVFACATLEDEVREVPGVSVSAWKIKGKTAIPQGSYRVTLEYSPRFGSDTLTLHDVPGFTGVRMHAGNVHEDTEGCPLLGMQATEMTLVGGTSKPAVKLVKQEVRAAAARGEEVTLDIINAVVLA